MFEILVADSYDFTANEMLIVQIRNYYQLLSNLGHLTQLLNVNLLAKLLSCPIRSLD